MRDSDSFGCMLQQQREAMAATVGDVARRLNIPPAQIEALEGGRFSAFPAHVYARGLCERYARFLSLPRDDVLVLFEKEWGLHAGFEESFQKTHPARQKKRIARLGIHAGVVLCGIAALGGGWWFTEYVAGAIRPPVFSVQSPSEGVLTHERMMTISGKADPRIELTINHQKIYMSNDGTFSRTVALADGLTTLTFEAKNTFGNISRIERHIVFESSGPEMPSYEVP